MVKKTNVKNSKTEKTGKSTKTQKKRVSKIVVQIRRVPSTEKITKVKKSSVNSGKSNNLQEFGEKPKRKYHKKKKLQENGEKLKFSIVDYLRTSISDKLGADEMKKRIKEEKKAERKAKKLNGQLGNISKDTANDFGNYELLGNDPDDFMIPLDVVISDDAPGSEEGSEVLRDVGQLAMDTMCTDMSVKNSVSGNKTIDSNGEVLMSSNEELDADSLRSAYKDVLGTCLEPEKGPKGTHFLLTDVSGSKSCAQCGASFSCGYKLKRHMLSHSDERKFFCDTCGSGFKTNYHLGRHKANVHSFVGIFSCELCDKEFTSRVSLKEHKMDQHPTKAATNLCSVCQKTYASRKGLKRHEKQMHINK